MRLSEHALRAAADAVRQKRYLALSVTDTALAEIAVVAYKEALPQRGPRPRPRPPRAPERSA